MNARPAPVGSQRLVPPARQHQEAVTWQRRAQPLLGTLVEIGVRGAGADLQRAIDAAFVTVREVQAALSRFDATSDIARFNALPVGASLALRPATRQVLEAARTLQEASGGAFDISLGTAPDGWRIDGAELHKLSGDARLDLAGIGKGFAVDRAVDTLIAQGCAAGWVNAGGDLRAFGDADVPIELRREGHGGTRAFATLHDGAFATSHFDVGSRSQVVSNARRTPGSAPGGPAVRAHVSVAAPLCLWADALTKIVAVSGDDSHPLLACFDARAWIHRQRLGNADAPRSIA